MPARGNDERNEWQLLANRDVRSFTESKRDRERKKKLKTPMTSLPLSLKKKKKKSRTHAALAHAAMASAFAALASAQPTSVTGLIQQIPVVGTQIKPCPPVGFDSLPNFDLTAYVSAPWYIQQQVRRFERPEEGTHDRGGEWGGRF